MSACFCTGACLETGKCKNQANISWPTVGTGEPPLNPLGTSDGPRCYACGCRLIGGTHTPGCPALNPPQQQPAWVSHGWRCPVCGRGNAPSTPTCPCVQPATTLSGLFQHPSCWPATCQRGHGRCAAPWSWRLQGDVEDAAEGGAAGVKES